jgi:hypothetical protein
MVEQVYIYISHAHAIAAPRLDLHAAGLSFPGQQRSAAGCAVAATGVPPSMWSSLLMMMLMMMGTACITALDPQRHFFFDGSEIDSSSPEIAISLHRPVEASEFALTFNEPWENLRTFGFHSVVDNGTHVLLYYFLFTGFPYPANHSFSESIPAAPHCNPAIPAQLCPGGLKCPQCGQPSCTCPGSPTPGKGKYKEQFYTCLATSTDGINFVKPILGVIEINGSTANNCVWPPGGWNAISHQTGSVFIDTNPAAPPTEKYKMIATYGGSAKTMTSPDGVHFTAVPTESFSGSDTQQVAWYDERLGKYVAYRRAWWHHNTRVNSAFCVTQDGVPKCGRQDAAGRQISRCVTDAATWPSFPDCPTATAGTSAGPLTNSSDLVFSFDEQDPPGMDLYVNSAVPYFGEYLIFPSMYLHFPDEGVGWPRNNDGIWSARIAHSHDGLNFSYIGGDRRPWVAQGSTPPGGFSPGPGPANGSAWDSAMIQVLRGMVVRDDTITMYKWGDSLLHHQCSVAGDHDDAASSTCAVPRAMGESAGIKRLRLRRDGFASVTSESALGLGSWPSEPANNNSGTGGAWFLTPVYTVDPAASLHINVVTAVGGALLVRTDFNRKIFYRWFPAMSTILRNSG